MKLPAIIGGGTAAKIETVRGQLGAAQARLDRLAGDRAAAVAGDAEIEAVRTIDGEIETARGEIVAYAERITALEGRLAVEEQERREADHKAAVEKFGKKLTPIEAAADDLETLLAGIGPAVGRYQRALASAAAAWPSGVPKFNSQHLDGGRLGDLLKATFSPGGLWRRHGNALIAGPDGREYVERAAGAGPRVAGFAQSERNHHAELMQDLRAAAVPEPALDDDASAAA